MGNTQSTRRSRDNEILPADNLAGGIEVTGLSASLDEDLARTHEHIPTDHRNRSSIAPSSSIYGSIRRMRSPYDHDHNNNNRSYETAIGERGPLLSGTSDSTLQFAGSSLQHGASILSQPSDHESGEVLNTADGRTSNSHTPYTTSRLRRRASLVERRISNMINNHLPSTGASWRHPGGSRATNRDIRGPFSIELPDTPTYGNIQPHQSASGNDIVLHPALREHETAYPSSARQGRFARARHSIHMPLTNFFRGRRERGSMRMPRSPTPHPGYTSEHSDSLSLSDSQHSGRHDREDVSHELNATESEARHLLSASRLASGMSSIRRLPQGLRSRSTRLIRRGEHPPLSQVLQLAAAAIAAQLSGQAGSGEGIRPNGGDTFDGSIQNFVQTLQEAASAQAGENVDLNATDSDLPPVNFMRVFQFPNDENGIPIGPPQSRSATQTHLDGEADPDRSVTLVLVGVRSMPNLQDGPGQERGAPGPSLDTLLSLPFMPPANILRNGSSGALFRRSDTRTRSSRRHSLTNFQFPSQYESQRHALSRTGSRGTIVDRSSSTASNLVPTPISESPPGPHPPPSTPADLRSGHVTPVQRPSSASALQASLQPHLEEDASPLDLPASSLEPPAPAATTRHQRRRSDSDFARRPELGAGAARRNGVVEPDRTSGGAGRSWLIYVVGTNVSPDHPAFTMPSLFTDNPSYEDMQMLSALLGPVKPPVATQDDVNSAGGTYRLIAQDGLLLAVPSENESFPSIAMVEGDRCLICLCDYEAEEQVRQLNSCSHIFHRDCIDEWLTTGRNSCPMCRGQGVKEQSSASGTTSA